MSAARSSCLDLLRGGLSWPGVVILWTGLWTLLDRHVPGGTGLLKELALAVAGAWIMIWTRTLFSNAGMDSLDYEGSLSEMGSLLAQGRLRWRDKAKFYARSFLAIAGSILFWDGVYTLCDEHTWEGTLMYNTACASLGGAGMVWVMTSEDDEDPDDEDGIDAPPAMLPAGLRDALQGKDNFSRLSTAQKSRLYAKALLSNICGVVFWKGVEEIVEDVWPDRSWTGFALFVVGISILLGTERLSMNSGLEDGLPLGMEIQRPSSAGTRGAAAAWESAHTGEVAARGINFTDSVLNDVVCPGFTWLVQTASGFCGIQVGASGTTGAGCGFFPRWVTTAAELTGVVFAWTGIEWYVWESDYILDTWFRDLMYIAAGLGTLIVTGTFFNLAGTISPMAALKQVHQHNRHEEATVPLLSTSDESLIGADTP
ncbi:unnamed protein product [Scytosiphon promiscuus]